MKIILILLQLCGSATLLPWAMGLMMAPMLFDSPDSSDRLFPYLMILGLVAYPILLGGCFWYAWQMEDIRLAALISAVPTTLFGGFLIYMFGFA